MKLLGASSILFCSLVAACGGSVEPAAGAPSNGPASQAATDAGGSPSTSADSGMTGGEKTASDCKDPEPVLASSGGSLARPSGSALRLELVYQGSEIGIREARGVPMVLSPADGPFVAGYNAGYWAELRDTSGRTTFTRLLQDPTVLEAPGANGGFTNSTVDRCQPKPILLDVPNDPLAKTLVVFGSGYGTQSAAAELARFTLR
jgi:hypothetical protein